MSDSIIKGLRDRRLNVWEQAKGLAERASNENRAFSAEEQSQWDEMNAEIDALDRRMKSIADAEARAKATEEKFAAIEGRTVEPGKGGETEDRSAELRAMLLREPGAPQSVMVRSGGSPIDVSYRTLSKLSGGAGANTVPRSFYDQLVEHMIEVSGVLQAGPTVLNTTSGEVIDVPKTTAHSTAAIKAEAEQLDTSEPTFGTVPLGAFKYQFVMYISRELVTDTGVDLEGYLSRQAGRALGNGIGADLVTGGGTTEPRGIVLDATVGATAPTGGFGDQAVIGEGFDVIIELFHSVISPYRMSRSCGWLMNDGTAAHVRKIKNTEGSYIWQPAVTIGNPDTILGKPVFIDPNVGDVEEDGKSIIFGDFAQYFARFAGGVRFERSDDFKFDTDVISYRAIQRADGATVDRTGALKVLEHSESS